MSAALVNTSWPSTAISADAQNLLGNFFALADDPAASAGPELASKVFTRDGVMKAATGAFEGSEAIAKSREHAWKVITERCHEVLKVYTSDPEGSDLLLIGKLTAGTAKGHAVVEFVARTITERTPEGLRMKLYEVWSDQTPLKELLSSS